MTDDAYDQVLEGIDRAKEKPAARSAPGSRQKAVKPSRPKRAAGTSQQYGRRADEAYVQVNASIRKELKPSLFFYLKEDGTSLSEKIEKFLEEYVEERGGIIGKRKRKA